MQENTDRHEDAAQPAGSTRERVLAKIRTGKVKAQSRAHIALSIAALIITALAILAVSALLINYIAFGLRVTQRDALLGFGPRGISAFLRLFPWPLVILDLLLVGVGEWLLRSFKFGYRIPVLYLSIGILIVVAALGVSLDRATPLNETLMMQADRHALPQPVGAVIERLRAADRPAQGVCRCVALSVGTTTITAYDSAMGTTSTYTIVLPRDSRATTSVRAGDVLFVAGDTDDQVFRAYGIRVIPRAQTIIEPLR